MNKPIPYNGISVVQNFICTIPERLELIKTNTPVVGKVWSDYEFFVNYNRETNFDEVHTIYKNSIPKDRFLDIGCGSGILSILAQAVGFRCITGIDNDENAIINSKQNLSLNFESSKINFAKKCINSI